MLLLRKGLHCHIYHVPVVCSDHLDFLTYHVEAASIADKHDGVTIGIKVVCGLTSGATRHEKESMILEVNLVSIGKHPSPIAHSVVLKKTSTDDVVWRLFNAHCAFE